MIAAAAAKAEACAAASFSVLIRLFSAFVTFQNPAIPPRRMAMIICASRVIMAVSVQRVMMSV
jgi:hypothetical protein